MSQRPLVLALSDESVSHLVDAIALHLRQYRRLGRPVPDELPALARALQSSVTAGQDESPSPACARTHEAEDMQPLLVPRSGAAHLLGCSESTVQRLVRAGDLKAVRVGGVTRYRVDELNAYVAALATAPSPAGAGEEDTAC